MKYSTAPTSGTSQMLAQLSELSSEQNFPSSQKTQDESYKKRGKNSANPPDIEPGHAERAAVKISKNN